MAVVVESIGIVLLALPSAGSLVAITTEPSDLFLLLLMVSCCRGSSVIAAVVALVL